MPSLMCFDTEKCPFYQNWAEQTNSKRIDIIIFNEDEEEYNCLAKIALEDPVSEGGILSNKELEEKLEDINSGCPHLDLLDK